MLAAYSLVFVLAGMIISSVINAPFWATTYWAGGLYVAGILLWILLVRFVDPFLDGALLQASGQLARWTKYGRLRNITLPYLSATVVGGGAALVLGVADPWIYIGGLVLIVSFLYMAFCPSRPTIPQPVLPKLFEPDLDPEPEPRPDEDEFERKRFNWGYWTDPLVGSVVGISADVRVYLDELRWAQEQPQLNYIKDWAQYVTDGIGRSLVDLSEVIRTHSRTKAYGAVMECIVALSFAQDAVQYAYDLDSTGEEQYSKYPVETLHDEEGDCEDKAILAGALMKRLGYDVALIHVPRHIVLGVAFPGMDLPGFRVDSPETGLRYYWCEATAKGCWIGELPGESPPKIEAVIPVV